VEGNEEPSSQSQGRTSGSMSSLGQPVSSRYPFQFRHPTRGHSRGHSMSSAGASHLAPQSHSSPSTKSQSSNSQCTGNRSSESPGPHDEHSGAPGSPLSVSSFTSHIPMPPRHPSQQGVVPAQGQCHLIYLHHHCLSCSLVLYRVHVHALGLTATPLKPLGNSSLSQVMPMNIQKRKNP
jgi:hypothetical protein